MSKGADLVDAIVNSLTFGLAFRVEFLLCAHSLECAERSDARYLKNRKGDILVAPCPFNGTDYLVLCPVKIPFRRFALDRVIKDRTNSRGAQLFNMSVAFLDRFPAAKLVKDRPLDQTLDRKSEGQSEPGHAC